MKKLSFVLITLVLASCLCFGTFTKAEAKDILLKLSTHGPQTAAPEKIMQQWAELVGEKTEGRVTIRCFFAGVLAKASDAKAAVESGVVDIAFVSNAETPSLVPLSLLLELPMVGFTDSRMGTNAWNELIDYNTAVAKEYKTVKVLFAWMANPRRIHMKNREIRVPADLKGMKVLAWGMAANAMQMIGAAPLQQSPADWYTSLDRGLVEGAVTASLMINMFKVQSLVTKHTIDVDLGFNCLSMQMNLKSWNRLPEEVKTLLDNELDPWALEEQIKGDLGSEKGIAAGWEAQGHTVIHPTAAEIMAWRDAIKPLHESVIADYEKKGLPGREIYDTIQNLIKKYGK